MHAYQNYQRIEVSTAEPLQVVILLYEGAIKNLNMSVRLFATDANTASARLNRTLDIIHYLRNSLDFEEGGRVSENLGKLYDYMRDVLAHANIWKDTEKIKEVIGLMQTLLEGWRGISTTNTSVGDGPDAAGGGKKVSLVG